MRRLTFPSLRRILLPVGSVVGRLVRLDRRCAMRRTAALWLVGILAAVGSVAAGIAWAQAPAAGGTIIFAAGADPDSLDPQNTQSNTGEQVNRMMYDNLVRFSTKMQIEPALAESWTQSKDGLVWTFKLRKGVKFHDGTAFDAKAVKYLFDRVLGEEKPFKASLYTPFVQGAQVVDDATIRVTLKQPFAAFLFRLAHSAGGIPSPAAHQKWGKDFALHPSGTGPFKFVEWVKGDRVVVERNDGYWGGRPLLDRVVVKTVKEDAARVLMLESGDADLILNIPPEDIPRLRKDARFSVESIATARALYVTINVKKKPFDDVRVRQALNYAVNREAIVKSLFQGNAEVISGIVAPLQNGYAKLPGYPFDPKKAKELLAQAGAASLKVKLLSHKGRYVKDFELVQAVQQDLSAVGVEAALSTMEWGAYLSATKAAPEHTDRELFMLGWSPSTGEAQWGTFPLLHSSQWVPKGDNRGFFSSKALDDALDRATTATSDQARLAALGEAQQVIIKEAPVIFLLSPNMVVGQTKKVHGVVNLPLELAYVVRRLLLLVPVLVGVSVVSFALLQLVPGDPALILAGEEATEEVLTRIRQEYGLNRPLPVQFLAYLRHAVVGDLGVSIQSRQPVSTLLKQRFPFTLKLAFLAILVSATLGVVAGIVAATNRNSPLDIAALLGSLVGISLPIFWLGLLAILIFSVRLHWLPSGGSGSPAHLVMPALVLGAASSAVIARTTRASMLEVLRQDYVRTARAKGVSDQLVVYRHALGNAMIPILTVFGLEFGYNLGGAVLTETVFSLPGVGRLIVEGIFARDYPVVQGALLVVATTFVLVNLLTDVAYAYFDPRIRYS